MFHRAADKMTDKPTTTIVSAFDKPHWRMILTAIRTWPNLASGGQRRHRGSYDDLDFQVVHLAG